MTNAPTHDVVELVELARTHRDVRAFSELVHQFQDRAFSLAYALLGDASLAEDATQEAFLAAFTGLESLRDPASFPAWFRTVVRTAANRVRRSRREVVRDPALLEATVGGEHARGDAADLVRIALDGLDDRERIVVSLYYLADHSVAEVAEVVGLSQGLIKKTLHYARKKLAKEIEAMGADEEFRRRKPSTSGRLQARVELFLEIRRGNRLAVEKMLAEHPDLVDARGLPDEEPRWYLSSFGNSTPLLWSIGRRDIAMVRSLIARGADVLLAAPRGVTPLGEAVSLGCHDIAALLLAEGADPNRGFGYGEMTALHAAVVRRDPAMVELLIEHGADPEAMNRRGQTPASWAHAKGFTELVALMNTKGGSR